MELHWFYLLVSVAKFQKAVRLFNRSKRILCKTLPTPDNKLVAFRMFGIQVGCSLLVSG